MWCGEDGQWRDVWLGSTPPSAAKVVVLRDGQPFSAVALWSEFVQTVKDKQTGQQVPNSMWSSMPVNQLAKCAEALALRKAFPQDLAGIYTDDEMGQADRPQDVPPTRRVTAAEIRREKPPQVIEAEVVEDPPIVEDPPADADWPATATIPGVDQ
jgi:hypothetical protein